MSGDGRLPALLRLYRGGLFVLEPAAALLLAWRARRGKEDPDRLPERRGRASRPRPTGPLAWAHGASIGEALSLLPIVDRLTRRGVDVLVTSGTRTSAELLARRLPPGAVHQFAPLDFPRGVRRFLDHWRPDVAVFAESEIWPNMILELRRRLVPLILVNGRVSERSFRRWSRRPEVAQELFGRFDACLAQSAGDAERLTQLGASRVSVAGNLKFDASPPPIDPRALAQLSGAVSGRPLWVAASTHPGEEEIVAGVHRAVAAHFGGLLTIVVPRHPERGEEVEAAFATAGLRTARRSRGQEPDGSVEVYVADTIGELGLFYRLSPLVFMGGSLVRRGGHNPIEPAKLGAAILHGPHVFNFAEVYAVLGGDGGALAVADGDALAHRLAGLLGDEGLTRDMARAGADAVARFGGAVERTMAAIEACLAPIRAKERA
jgi:3-deoxy-D-manno-octulosonic-acid transferase